MSFLPISEIKIDIADIGPLWEGSNETTPSASRLSEILTASKTISLSISKEYQVLSVESEQTTSVKFENITDKNLNDLIPNSVIDIIKGLVGQVQKRHEGNSKTEASTNYWINTSDGKRYFRLSIRRVPTNRTEYIYSIANEDITEQKVEEARSIAMKQSLFKIVQMLTGLFEHSPNGKVLINMDGQIIDVNGSAGTKLGKEPDELKGMNISDIVNGSLEMIKTKFSTNPNENHDIALLKIPGEDGEIRYLNLSVMRADDEYFFLTIRDDTAVIIETKRLEELSKRDALTGLNNRAFFEQEIRKLDEEVEKDKVKEPYSVILCDVNGLKELNDTYGHDAGDELLKAVATVFTDTLRNTDIVARIGGDEFAILLPNTNDMEAMIVVQKILEKCLTEYVSEKIHKHPSIAVGVATKVTPGTTISKVMKTADLAMYQNKKEYKEAKARIEAGIRKSLLAEMDFQI
ncbi:MAG: sensor domain-containing diguanylate cyclase [bacterium]